MKTSRILFLLQGFILLVLFFGDIGFDKPGRFGLDFGHFLLLLCFQILLLFAFLMRLAKSRAWRLFWFSLFLLSTLPTVYIGVTVLTT